MSKGIPVNAQVNVNLHLRAAVPLLLLTLCLVAATRAPNDAQTVNAQGKPAYLDPAAPLDTRIADLIGRMTLQEKIDQLSSTAPGIPRLEVPAYDWWNEALHGVARAGRATVYPQAIGLAATFDPALMGRISSAIADEARAKHNASVKAGVRERYRGLTFWTPNINIFRDPRWGRGQETYGEDPFLTATMGVAFVKGLQGDDPQMLKAAACAKHFAVHSGPESQRHSFNAVASPKDLNETYLPAFHALVDAGVETVMCAYNRTNGEPCCGSKALLVDTLRGAWGFKGHVVSDCGAISDIDRGHKVTASSAESAALAIKTGTDLACTSYRPLKDAVDQGLVREADIDAALTHVLRTRFRLGLLDPPDRNPYANIAENVIASPEHRALAREAAVKSLVLLKNSDHLLPLRKNLRKVFITGPLAADAQVMLANYYGVNEDVATVLEGIAGKVSAATSVLYEPGCLLDRPNANPISPPGSARDADVTIAVMGISGLLEGEEGEAIASPGQGDRLDLNLPPNQLEFLRALRKTAKTLVVVVLGGSPITMPEVHELADAVVFAWYPGEEGGRAVADVLFGDAVPSGRLPITFPRSVDQLPPYDSYAMTGRTYRYMTQEPLYPFGFGLSYATITYTQPVLTKPSIAAIDSTTLRVTVTNTGTVAAEDVVQLYVSAQHPSTPSTPAPIAALKAFQRVSLAPGASRTVDFPVTPRMLALINDAGQESVEKGEYRLTVGGASPGARAQALGAPVSVQATLTVR
jgi:beta-glucosidase